MTQDNRIYDSRNVANLLLEWAEDDERAFIPAQVVKLVYLCHGWTLGLWHRPSLSKMLKPGGSALSFGVCIMRSAKARTPSTAARMHPRAPVLPKKPKDVLSKKSKTTLESI